MDNIISFFTTNRNFTNPLSSPETHPKSEFSEKATIMKLKSPLRVYSRTQYALYSLSAFIILTAIGFALGTPQDLKGAGCIFLFVVILLSIPRLRDLGENPWLCLVFFLPILNLTLFLYLLFKPATRNTPIVKQEIKELKAQRSFIPPKLNLSKWSSKFNLSFVKTHYLPWSLSGFFLLLFLFSQQYSTQNNGRGLIYKTNRFTGRTTVITGYEEEYVKTAREAEKDARQKWRVENEQLRSENNALKRRIGNETSTAETSIAHIKASIEPLKQQVDKLIAENRQLSEKNKQLTERIADLNVTTDRAQEVRTIQALTSQKADLEQSVIRLRAENERLRKSRTSAEQVAIKQTDEWLQKYRIDKLKDNVNFLPPSKAYNADPTKTSLRILKVQDYYYYLPNNFDLDQIISQIKKSFGIIAIECYSVGTRFVPKSEYRQREGVLLIPCIEISALPSQEKPKAM